MPTTKKFHLGDILSVTDGKLVSSRHMSGVYDIMSFLFGENLSTIGLISLADKAREELVRQFPWTKTAPVLTNELNRLPKLLQTDEGKKNPDYLVIGWLSHLTNIYGEYHNVVSIN